MDLELELSSFETSGAEVVQSIRNMASEFEPSVPGGLEALVTALHLDVETAALAAETLGSISRNAPESSDAVREAGALPALVRLLGEPAAALNSANTLGQLAYVNSVNRDTIRELGGIAPLVALLHSGSHATSSAAASAVAKLVWMNATNKVAVSDAGAIPLLVALLEDEPSATAAAAEAAANALRNVTCGNAANREALRCAGGIEPLVALLSRGTDVQAAVESAFVLQNLLMSPANEEPVLDAFVARRVFPSCFPTLSLCVRSIARTHLDRAMAGDDAAALGTALLRAQFATVADYAIADGRFRLDALMARADAQRERGAAARATPDVAPLTPVQASEASEAASCDGATKRSAEQGSGAAVGAAERPEDSKRARRRE